MNTNKILWLGWFSSALFIFGSLILGSLVRDYDPITQTVSEIGREGSPMYLNWQLFSLTVGTLLIIFAFGLNLYAKQRKWSILPGIFMMLYGISQFGIGWFPSPHFMHNIFGLSMTIGYFTPLVFALSWKNSLGKSFKMISVLAFVLIMSGIFLNLTPAFAPDLYPMEYYGLVQRFLLFTFYIYVGFVSLRTRSNKPDKRGS
ncbi:DUF998 domain-containing protein [Lutimonas saemankumensis]|uniref:DUF998 domain-containing protein n=1 Tax=Lutimonas saemankumensis TaxID=483016 RepID=UPI001CD2428C|nr:DUF998 domain-containing protein [Lutimonas saemankumensis]MCA0931797.1 DUF998 domain-containing protein [Lutimonas saemankumensis]